MKRLKYLLLYGLLCIAWTVRAENGSRLWLPAEKGKHLQIAGDEGGATLQLAVRELQDYWKGQPVVLGTSESKAIRKLGWQKELRSLGAEGFIIREIKNRIVIAANSEIGVLYGAYELLRMQQAGMEQSSLNRRETPAYRVRILNHWDNLDRTVERGYAGYSLWKWDELPDRISPRYREYARANASIGINGCVLNNVNASPLILKQDYLLKVKALADIFRPYGIRVYLSVNFSSPVALDSLPNADPVNPEVKNWWKTKAKEIYRLIPDFGGFLVKANSEGLPGPQDYGRTHAQGANMLADALKPYGGIVMWRAFVYQPGDTDRAAQAYREFMPLDGLFRENVLVQVKNGPVDFQPREPFSPLFGAMRHTPVMPEFQITQEYLGFSNHLVYLAPLFKECLDSDTYAHGVGSTVAEVTDGTLYPHRWTGIAGVANIGEDANWCGHPFAQANWYAFGRLAWNPQLSAGEIAEEWLKMTFTTDSSFVLPVQKMMLDSREAAVNYMMPMGLHHLFAWGHHYGPEPWCDAEGARPDWLPSYYHRADSIGLGFDRSHCGSNAVAQYFSPLQEQYDNLTTCPENLILWFHHVSWGYQMKNGQTLWDNLCRHYQTGVEKVREFQKIWDKLDPQVDSERFQQVQAKLKIQTRDAIWWRDACLLYFQGFSRQPIPYDLERPLYDLQELKKIRLDLKHHN